MLFVIPLAYSALGAFSMVVQTILLREFFVVAAGNEISFGIAMGGWLLGVGAGSVCGAFFSSRRPLTASAFYWTALAMAAVAPLLLAGARCLHLLGAIAPGAPLPLAKTLYLIPLLTLPFSFLSGFAFPLAAKLRARPENDHPPLLVGAYIWECLGAMAAAMAYTFWLVGKFNPLLIIELFTLPLLVGSGTAALAATSKRKLAFFMLALALNLAALFGGAGRIDSWLVRQRWLGISSSDLIANRDSKYQNLQLGLRHGQYSLYANGQLAAVFPNDDTHKVLAAQLISQHPRPANILVIGGASGGLAQHLLRYRIARLTTVEIDAEISGLISEHLAGAARSALRDPRLRLMVMDGRRFIRLADSGGSDPQNRFDLAFIYQPDAWTAQLNRYYTREFFLDLKKILTPGGVLALRLSTSENVAAGIINPYTSVIFQTLKSVFPFIAVSPGPTSAFFASENAASVTTEIAVLRERYRAMALPPAGLEQIFTSLYPPEKIAFVGAALQMNRVPALNRDQKPIAYFLGGRVLGWNSGTPLSGLFRLFGKAKLPIVLMLMGVLLLPSLLLTLYRRKNRVGLAQVLPAAASGGFAGLSFEITAIFIFQNHWGYVYQAIGLLIALFMLGLGTGAALAGRIVKIKSPTAEKAARWLAAIQTLIAVLNMACLPLLGIRFNPGWPGQLLLAAWLGGMGMLVGSILPLGMSVMRGLPAGVSAGLLNAGDVLGGAVGSLLTAAFFLPLLGTDNSLLLISLFSLGSAALLLLAARAKAIPS